MAVYTAITPELRERMNATDEEIVVVTGASSGIGAATAIDLSADRTVIAVGRDADRLADVAAQGRDGAIIALSVDLTDLAGIADAFAELPRLNALVNNAAVMYRTTSATATTDQWHDMFAINVFAPAELSRVLMDRLRETQGAIVFIGSGASRTAVPGHLVYAASKHAAQAVADGIRLEVAADGVRVSTVAPGPTATNGAFRMDDLPTNSAAGDRISPLTVARSIRHVIDAPADTQIAEVWVRPRVERK